MSVTPLTNSPRILRFRSPVPAQSGGALAAKGFRPFFLLAAVFAAAIVPLWLLILSGHAPLTSSLPPQAWHAHEMIFGYAAAVIAGFLLTAVSNWTKRETLIGAPLLGLAALWLLGRVLLLDSALAPAAVTAAVDVAFLPCLAIAIARALIGSGNRRNYVMIALLLVLAAANGVTHLDAAAILPGWGRRATFAGLNVIILLMLLMSGRIIPMFTRNALRDEHVRSSNALDRLSLLAMACVLLGDLVFPAAPALPFFAAAAGVLALARTRHWGTFRTGREPMLWILHGGHAWIGLGLLLKALAPLAPVLASSSTHALTVGAIGWLSMGMMARVSLGHTGRMITATQSTRAAFALLGVATAVRVTAPLWPGYYLPLLTLSGTLWTLSFAVFLFEFAPILCKPRVDGVPG